MLDEFVDLIELEGESYKPLKLATLYSLAGNTIKHNIIKIGKVYLDTRINLGVPLKSGHGKTVLKNFIGTVVRNLGKTFTVPSSLHPEQLVGKVIITEDETGKRYYQENKGFLADDYLVFDEAIELLTDKSYAIARDYINIALDPIGWNEIVKRSVEVPPELAIRYTPNCTITFFFHPVFIPPHVLYRGFLRRISIVYIHPSYYEKIAALEKSFDTSFNIELYNRFINRLRVGYTLIGGWQFESVNRIIYHTKKLIEDSMGPKLSYFVDTMMFTLRDRLIKMACIRAAFDSCSAYVTNYNIDRAAKDLDVLWNSQLNYVEDYVMVSPEVFVYYNKVALLMQTLAELGASPQNPIRLSELIDKFAQKAKISKSMARNFIIQATDMVTVQGDYVLPRTIKGGL